MSSVFYNIHGTLKYFTYLLMITYISISDAPKFGRAERFGRIGDRIVRSGPFRWDPSFGRISAEYSVLFGD